jgi:hypothetical protein
MVARFFKFPLDGFITVELTVHDDADAAVLACYGLISSCKVDDAQPRTSESHSPVRCDPMPLSVGTAMIKALRRALHNGGRYRIATRQERDNSADPDVLLFRFRMLTGSAPKASIGSRNYIPMWRPRSDILVLHNRPRFNLGEEDFV